jgi:hypothetical protein
VRRAALVAAAALLLVGGASGGAHAQGPDARNVLVIRTGPTTLRHVLDALGELAFRPAGEGGVALLAHASRLDDVLAAASADPGLDVTVRDEADVAGAVQLPEDLNGRQLWIVSPGSAPGASDLGVVVMFGGLITEKQEIPTLTSDSTRRVGVVVAEDLLPTMESMAGLPDAGSGGAVIRSVNAPVPLELMDRYVANRRMSVPIQTAAGLYVTFAGLLGVTLLAMRRRVPPWLSSLGAWIAIATVPLALALLLAGHLPTLSYATVLPAVIGGTLLGTAAFVPVGRARGTLDALAWMGAVVLAVVVLEAALGWTAAMFTFLGGTELDGGRFYGLPNVDIGLLLGASVFVASRLRRTADGVALIAAVALFAGLPFAGANLGAAVTLAATAGLWWGLRDRRGTIPTAIACVVAAGVGLVVVLLLNRFLPGPPTHITNFVEGQGDGVLSTVAHRLRTGLDLIARNPFAIAPVIGVPATLLAVLRPAAPVRASFDQHPGWREALLTILWGSVVAYVANDTGAAALGLGFGTALGGLLFVSLRDRPWMMGVS